VAESRGVAFLCGLASRSGANARIANWHRASSWAVSVRTSTHPAKGTTDMYKHILATIAITVWTLGCSDSPHEPAAEASSGWEEGTITERSAEPTEAAREPAVTVELEAADGAEVEGEAKFFDDPDGVRVVLEVQGAPAGKRIGAHIHEKGDCSDIEGQSMGAHLAPEGAPHALPEERAAGARHMGDLGNIDVGPDGKGRLEAKVEGATLAKGVEHSVRGRAIVVHGKTDIGEIQQPSGGSGTPIACAVIE
jgi:Cu-Zn family superoxide dismutase